MTKILEMTLQQMGNRRSALKLASWSSLSLLLGLSGDANQLDYEQPLVDSEESILNRVKEKEYAPNSEIRTTIFPRKIMWEMVQVRKARNEWSGKTDESDWYHNQDIFKEGLAILQEAGITGARLVIAPHEIVNPDGEYHWEATEAAINLLRQYGITNIDLSVGPFNTAYAPGVRFPQQIENKLKNLVNSTNIQQINISMGEDPQTPELSKQIRNFGLTFLDALIAKYGDDERIDKFYLGNEWPDVQSVENVTVPGTGELLKFEVAPDFMSEAAQRLKDKTTKKIALNTNIQVDNIALMKEDLGEILDTLGDRAVLGLDPYPTREKKRYSPKAYKAMIDRVRLTFPKATLVYTEYQSAPWPEGELNGKSWEYIYSIDPQLIYDYYMNFYSDTLDTHLIPSKIAEFGIWGAEVIVVLNMLGYTFPTELFHAMNEGMKRNKQPDEDPNK